MGTSNLKILCSGRQNLFLCVKNADTIRGRYLPTKLTAIIIFGFFIKEKKYTGNSSIFLFKKNWLTLSSITTPGILSPFQLFMLLICHSIYFLFSSWHWLLLTDFAPFKPIFLPEDNPADYSYFFDTSRLLLSINILR